MAGLSPGDQVIFLGYNNPLAAMEPIFHRGDLAVVAAVDRDGMLTCFPVDHWSRVFSAQGEMLFPEEVLRLGYAKKVPSKRLPHPYGSGDNEMEIPTIPSLLRSAQGS